MLLKNIPKSTIFLWEEDEIPESRNQSAGICQKIWADGFPVSVKMLQLKDVNYQMAWEFLSEFKASYDWAKRFVARNDLMIQRHVLKS